ncbi:LacI family DNA-binding transcriptional regulator [Rhodobacteraceae bacterium HSP-20]|uniref:LacI family DNA-binding transcriptional regulator n=1 Tax=Paragemmobacter amnigenus TaxID=2852097 RepID=A0ABS6J7J7_9RHOB|nr:LacI family DNA-binding transcriptional regulator [Rhodobacter amnigenus]MBU9699729.1 LacI family DNA-binding transcriptional regulator [Rhodobacter amnigenus]MBV4390956.1 LacI family DNA-binding transcriptional regulator [Rhodobacter amnigenus]
MAKKTSSRVTLSDVAALAGVGSATVDRVINDRGNVSDDVRKRVLDAARTLGLKRILPSSHHSIVRLNVILARPELPLIRRMGFEFRRLAQRMNHSLAIHRTVLEDEEPATIVAALDLSGYDAAIVYAQDHPLIRAAIADLARQGRPVVTMISDLPGSARLAYAGTDHYKAGRSAGYFLDLMARPGSIVVLCNHLGFQSHAERLYGLKDQLAETGKLVVAEVVEGGDDAVRSEVRLKEAFRRNPSTVAVYNIGAGNRGVVGAIKSDILPSRPLFIGHELTPFTHVSLREGTMTLTIDQSPELQAQFALEVLLNHFGFEGVTDLAPPYTSTVPIVLYGPQNLPDSVPG